MPVNVVLNSTHKIILDIVCQLPLLLTLLAREARRDLEQTLMDKRTLAQLECDGRSVTCDAATFCILNRPTWLLDKSDKLAQSGFNLSVTNPVNGAPVSPVCLSSSLSVIFPSVCITGRSKTHNGILGEHIVT